jgi:hypothetical protein
MRKREVKIDVVYTVLIKSEQIIEAITLLPLDLYDFCNNNSLIVVVVWRYCVLGCSVFVVIALDNVICGQAVFFKVLFVDESHDGFTA